MEPKYAGKWIWFFNGVDNGPPAVKQSAQGQPEKADRLKGINKRINCYYAQPTHDKVNHSGYPSGNIHGKNF